MRINLAGDAVEKWSCNFRRENRNICISTPGNIAKKDLWGSPNSQRSEPSCSRPIHLPPGILLGGVGDPTVLVVRTDQVRMPAGNKKGGRECRQSKRGLMRRKCWRGIQQHNLLQRRAGAVDGVYELPKKRSGPTRSLVRRIVPSQKGTN